MFSKRKSPVPAQMPAFLKKPKTDPQEILVNATTGNPTALEGDALVR